jgi:transcriptional regulator with XRE-family HTH domain
VKDHETTARSRELGIELRRARERIGYTGGQLARKLGWSNSRISRLEGGTRGASAVDVATFLGFCQVAGPERDRLMALCREVYSNTWLRPHGGALPDELFTLILHETTASRIISYEPHVVPGLLQTEDYIRAVFRWSPYVSEDAVEPLMQVRLNRQDLLRRQPQPDLIFFIPEQVLRSVVGTNRIMNDQLLHMALVSARLRCTIRVVPAAAGPHGVLGGPFRVMEYADHRPVTYLETPTSSLFLEEPQEIGIYRTALHRLASIALDGEQSREFLARLASEYDPPEEGNHGLA